LRCLATRWSRRGGSRSIADVVLDLVLPGAHGFDILGELVEEAPGRPVVVVSGLLAAEAKVRCLDIGAIDDVTKPSAWRSLS
jgi:DNA-binding response OmpR family regulator